MPSKASIQIQDHFEELTDPRTKQVTYPLVNVVTIAVCAVICGRTILCPLPSLGKRVAIGWPSFWT
jgi:hypothetical protein